MRSIFLTIVLLFGFISLMAKDGYQVNYKPVSSTVSQIEFTLDDFSLKPVNYDGTDFTKIQFASSVTTEKAGFAELPYLSATIQLKPDKNVDLMVISSEYVDYQLTAPLVPSRGVIYRNQDPSKIPYLIAPESLVDDFYPADLTFTNEPFIVKDVRGLSIYVQAFQYNAVQQVLRVYKNVIVKLTENNSAPINPLTFTSGKYFREMEALYQSVFLNYESTADLTMAEAGDILVITTSRDEDAIQPYIDWKREKGFKVFKEVVVTGTNVKSLVQQQYNANPDILYVQLVGDWADIKCDLGGGANAPMDVMLGCVVGNDNFPDIAIGRFSAATPAHVTTQVNKLINYEKNPQNATWYSKALSVASNEGAGIGDDGEIDYQHTDIIYNYKLQPFSYDGHSTAYAPSATILQVKNAIENGVSIINYCGHGSSTSWVTTGFSNTNVNQLTNGDMLPFIFSVACVNGAYHSGECFAEAWLKKENGGAVLTLMSTINQSWVPPMRGQDYFNDLLTGGYDYQANPGNGISTTEGRSIIGSIVVNGFVLMLTESSSTTDLQTVQTWITFGDPSMQVRTVNPDPLNISNNIMLVGTPFETTVTSNGQPVEGALVSLSQNGNYVSAYSDAFGNVSIENEFLPGDVLLVVTAFNKETIYTNIQCIPPTGPYVIFDSVTVNDSNGNNNGQLDYGETSFLDLSVKNVGVTQADNVVVSINSTSPYVTILNGTANYGNIAAGGANSLEEAFTIKIAEDVPNNQGILFSLIAVGQDTWESSFSLMAYTAVLNYDSHTISDPTGNNNGKLDPGETATFFIVVKNFGNSDASNVIGTLTSSSPYITISQGQANYGNIAAGEESQKTFIVSAAASTPAGQMVTFNFDITADLGITGTGQFTVVVGQIPVLIIDMDKNHNSAPKIVDALNQIGISHELVTTFPNNLSLYSSIFVCLGVYSNNHILTAQQGSLLAAYLNDGGRLYMEGGDTWYYNSPTAVHAMFGILGQGDGSGDLSTIVGMAGTFTEGMSFPYNGDNNWIDRIAPTGGGATLILQNNSPVYGTAVANDGGVYKTIGASHEFGGLNGDRKALLEEYLDFFDMLPSPLVASFTADVTEGCAEFQVQFTDQSVGASSWNWTFPGGIPDCSAEQNPVVTYGLKGDYDVTLEISDGTNTTTLTYENYIHVMDVPDQAGPIIGDTLVAMGDITDYYIDALANCLEYHWELTPQEAGVMTANMNNVTISWSEDWYGFAILKVCGQNECGPGLYSEDFVIHVFDPDGIQKLNESLFNIFPNPSKGRFAIEFSSTENTKYQLTIVNLLGIEVYGKEINVNLQYFETFDVSQLSEGIYYLYLKNDQQLLVKKLIIRK
ncbi:MAG TPA: C25 family cysteine peptidase [Bacteroidales bacterium]|nr:C25 family cysteine peptidase [Bacteroidales bacterium]HOR76135.1 C25 family cysteine peptidase [Bacteroidales bacterium]HPL11557.1 C25 family cysteine peptidase [Bacteroidales bacterium]